MKSSRRISPGWIGSSSFDGFIVISRVLVVIHNFNVMRIAVTPREADAPLVIDSNAIRPRAVALQRFKLIPWRHAKILQPPRLMQVQKLPPRRPLDGLKSPDRAVLKEQSGVRAPERSDQIPVYDVSGIMSNVIDSEENGGPPLSQYAGSGGGGDRATQQARCPERQLETRFPGSQIPEC